MTTFHSFYTFLSLKNPIFPSDPGIFSEHEEKQVSRRYLKKVRDTDRLGEVEESSMQSFPWQLLTLLLSFSHTQKPTNLMCFFLTKAVKTQNSKSQRKTNTTQVKDHIFFLSQQWLLAAWRISEQWVNRFMSEQGLNITTEL